MRIYTTDHELLAAHNRATEPGQRITNPNHLPPSKLPGITLTREGCRAKALLASRESLKYARRWVHSTSA